MLRLPSSRAVSVFAALLVLAGCNVLDPAFDEGGDVETLLEDARYARAGGDFERATELLEEAYAKEPKHPVVRVELAGALLRRESLNSVNLIARIAEHVEQGTEDVPSGPGQRSGACSWNDAAEFRTFDPSSLSEFPDVVAARSTLNRIRGLFTDAEAPIMPAGMRELNTCTVARGGEVGYDRNALLDELYTAFEGDYNLVRTALLLNAATLTLDAYVELFADVELPVDWFLVGDPEAARLGFCTDPLQAPSFTDHVASEADRLGRALVSVDLLIHDANQASLAELRDDALEFYGRFEDTMEPICG